MAKINLKWKSMLALGAGMLLCLFGQAPAQAQPKEVKVGVIAPISGPWARQGELMSKGAQLAIDHINGQGGIKALGGAKLRLMIFDTGDSVEKAKNAAQRMVSEEPDLVGATGCFLSSFTLAVTEVTERAELPFLTFSYSDVLINRGFKYIFKTSPTGGQLAESALPTILKIAQDVTGKKPATLGIVMDNTASPVSFTKQMREGGIAKLGLKLVVDQTFTPPLADATSLIQQVRSSRPDILLMLATSVPDDKIILEKLTEFGLGGGRIPVVANGTHIGVPELAKTVDHAVLEGVMSIVSNWGAKGQEKIIKEFQERTGQPWMTEEFHVVLWRHVDLQGGAGSRGRGRPQEGRAGHAGNGSQGRSGALLSRPPREVRREGTPGRRRASDLPVAEGRAGDGLSNRFRGSAVEMAEILIARRIAAP